MTTHETLLKLKNGKDVFLRPIIPADENLVIDFFVRLSPQSLYLRFLNQSRILSKKMLHHFININYKTEFALVGIIKEDNKDTIVAIARYAYSIHYNTTDLAVAVRDDWQHQGLGKEILRRVVDFGKENGIFRFDGIIHPENKIIMQILSDLGYKVAYSLQSGLYAVEIIP